MTLFVSGIFRRFCWVDMYLIKGTRYEQQVTKETLIGLVLDGHAVGLDPEPLAVERWPDPETIGHAFLPQSWFFRTALLGQRNKVVVLVFAALALDFLPEGDELAVRHVVLDLDEDHLLGL